MHRMKRDLVVIGGGPAGISAAIAAKKAGISDVLLIERDKRLGGILNQCIHDGFGLHRFGETLTGPEYAQRHIDQFEQLCLEAMLNTIVLSLGSDRRIQVSSKKGFAQIEASAVILAMGCRERTAGAISLPGTRPAGIYTAGAAQNMINLQNFMVGRRAVILGSGDIGMIMARRMTLEGAQVEAVFELLPYPSGLQRNIQQCLNDFDIPLHLSTTVTEVHGKDRLSGVTVAQVDSRYQPIESTRRHIPCDTLLLSIGLIPENELTRQAGISISPSTSGALVDDSLMTAGQGVFSCGNVLHVHDLVDYVSEEAELAGANAARYLRQSPPKVKEPVAIKPAQGVRYVMPQKASGTTDFTISLRVANPGQNQYLSVRADGRKIARRKKIRLHPAEMERIKVRAENLDGAKTLEVGIE